MNRQHMLFLPTAREQKCKAQQVIDSFAARPGDVVSAASVWPGTAVLSLDGVRSEGGVQTVAVRNPGGMAIPVDLALAATLQGLVSISVWAGVLLSATYLLTGRLWLGIGLHAAWNYTQGTVYSSIVSGNAPPEGFFKSTLQGSEWLTGSVFGVEASIVALAVCAPVGVLMLGKAVRLGRIVPPPWKRKR